MGRPTPDLLPFYTTWGSPVSSNPAVSPAYVDGRGASGYVPLLASGLGALSRALVAGVTAIVGNKTSSSSDTEDAGVGPGNVQRQRNEREPKPPPFPMISDMDINVKMESRLREDGLGASGRRVVVEDEDESVVSSASMVLLQATGTGGDILKARKDSPDLELEMMKGRLVPLVVANRTPSPASIRVEDTSMDGKELYQEQEEEEQEQEKPEQKGLEQEGLEGLAEASWEKESSSWR